MTSVIHELRPLTSISTRRYECPAGTMDTYHITTEPGLRPLVDGNSEWKSFIHPEGRRYFHRQHAQFSIVTEENISDKETDDLVSYWLAIIEKKILECGVALPQACELFIEFHLDKLPHTSTCVYYFVDHYRRCLFWLEPTSSELLDMGMLVSESHLDIALEKLYWVHVEFFPMHIYAQMAPHILEELISVMSHGMIDRLTSRTSTFPYAEAKCSQLLQTLSLQRGKPLDGHTLCFVARLWGAINGHRFITYYGQENAQLDRLHSTMSDSEDVVDHPEIRALANLIMWRIPNHYYTELHDLFVNDQVYVDQWQAFMTRCISEWKGMFAWAFSVLITSILISILPHASVTSAVAPILAASSSLVSGSILLLRHHGFQNETASFAVRFLLAAKSSEWGFLPLSVVYSMPTALYLWSLGLMVAQFMFWVSRVVGVQWALGGTVLLGLMGCGILYFTSLEDDLPDPMGGILCTHWSALQNGSDEAV